jgi:UDP-N-acetylglucosamine--N-acetylmuramyl-(pentapeptide) pyrophosphoryl-undecaprenol N-acetylglucosamine transferase
MTYVFAAAGTGGHVYPALAVADALVASGVGREEVLFVGGDRMEASAVPASGYAFVGIDIRGLRRSWSTDNLTLPAVVWRAARRLAGEFRRRGTRVVTAFGGYVSVPAAWAARRQGARLFVQEQNAIPGLANRLISGSAVTSFVAFPEALHRLRHPRLVGNPLRAALAEFDRDRLRADGRVYYGIDGTAPVLGVLGGSLGAAVLNDVAVRVADAHEPERLTIVHLTGAAHHDAVARQAAASPVRWVTRPFEDRMDLFYATADVVLSRAGALTISELAATATPAVVVPYAAGTAGHQSANAAHLERSGGVVVVAESEIDRVPVELEQLLSDEPRRAAMARAAAAEGLPHAAAEIARALREAAA